jgi:paraquat-inducible protein A
MKLAGITAMRAGLWSCRICKLVSKSPLQGTVAQCPRCRASIHARKPDALARTWALLSAAAMLYLPANILPVMETNSLFGSENDTILSGVVYLWTSGSWPLALLVFIASITVPLLKLISLAFLLISVQLRSAWRPDQRARLYRIVEFIGRWSMLDIYVATILAALVHLQGLATIIVGPGAIAFGAVVVLTMFAAMSFDPRLIWDRAENTGV